MKTIEEIESCIEKYAVRNESQKDSIRITW